MICVFIGDKNVVKGGPSAMENCGEMKKNEQEIVIPSDTLVSVVMATYKREEALRNALQSLTNQTYKNFEVVLVDDNGNVEWVSKVQAIVNDVCEKFSINYIINKHNMGPAATRNRGIEAAKGQYITFLDDDDVFLPEKIEMQLKDMIVSDADFDITNLYLYNEKGELVDKRIRSYIKSTDTNELMRYHLLQHMTGTDTFMFKTEYLRKIGGFPRIDVGDEFYLMKEAIINGGKFKYSDQCYVKAYVHSGELEGISSGERKINGENALFQEKKKYFNYLTKKDIRYVKMRHYAVIAFAEMRRKNIKSFVVNAIRAFFTAPIACVQMYFEHK